MRETVLPLPPSGVLRIAVCVVDSECDVETWFRGGSVGATGGLKSP